MSMLARRAVLRTIPRTRGVATDYVSAGEYRAKVAAQEHHAAG
jgi:hypothetical protein